MATEPKDRTGEVWELPTGSSFLVTGPPTKHAIFGTQHPYLMLARGRLDDGPSRGVVQEKADASPAIELGGFKARDSFEERGWRRLA